MSSPIFARSADFLVQISQFYEQFCKTGLDDTVARKLLLSALECGNNINRAIYGKNKEEFTEFLHKALKDIAESIYLLNVLWQSGLFSYNYALLLQVADEIKGLLISSINAGRAANSVRRYGYGYSRE